MRKECICIIEKKKIYHFYYFIHKNGVSYEKKSYFCTYEFIRYKQYKMERECYHR